MRRWFKLVEGGCSQHQQRQHGRLALGGMVTCKGCVEPTAWGGSHVLAFVMHVRSPLSHAPHWQVRHCRQGAGTQQKAMEGAGKGSKHRQPDHDRRRNQAAGEIACCLPY